MARKRINKAPVKVFSTKCKAVGIVAKYLFEKEINNFRLSQHEVQNRSAANIMRLVQADYAQAMQL